MDYLFRKFKAAFNGLYMCYKDFSIRIQIVITLCVVAFGFVYKFNLHEWMWIISCIMLVLICEVFNTAIEKVCDLIDRQYNEAIKVIKDLSAGAVLIASIYAIIVGCIILKGVLR